MFSKPFLAVAIYLATYLPGVSASTCFNFGVGPSGDCFVDARAVERFQAYINADDSNANCNSGGEIDMSLVYQDTQGNVKTAAALEAASFADAASTVNLLDFNVPISSIATGVPATLLVTGYVSGLATPYSTSVVWTQDNHPTISYVTSTATVTAYTTVGSTTTSTVTENRYTTTTPGFLKTATVTTKVATSTPAAPSTTTTTTIVPSTITSTKWGSSTTTKTLSCDPQSTGAAPHRVKRNFFDATYSAPSCVPSTAIKTTTIVNKVVTSTSTSTITTTATQLTATIKTTTVTAKVGKTKYVGATTTTISQWPTNTFHMWTRAAIPTQVVTVTRVTTAWVAPGKATGSGACKPVETYSLSSTAQVFATVLP
ncbi:hypothetical protein K461DRAFT_300593 [Myriangium duriaei CBS 260.36]|uniref:Ig-like domain-containing protein n=1 Tax=Myriangium duriaei CBS 260.36 TaxID=1168546 RepID=A0A9P4IXA3_9PEZI|nr:hypothetical protein K461DRAFT_300593 [Myriangium duriaei CBS 260.36]